MEQFPLPVLPLIFALLIVALPAEQLREQSVLPHQPLAETTIFPASAIPHTESSFATAEYTTVRSIPFRRRYKLDPTLSCGEEEVHQKGKEGKVTKRFRRIIWQGGLLRDELVASNEEPAVEEIISLGTKPKETFLVDGHPYNCVLQKVWATSYDGGCRGCSGRTHYTNEPVRYGICAVNPDIITPLSYFYVPGYGRCLAADKGSALKGRHIDLGFDDVRNGWWHARYTDVYLLR